MINLELTIDELERLHALLSGRIKLNEEMLARSRRLPFVEEDEEMAQELAAHDIKVRARTELYKSIRAKIILAKA